ncbi:MAG: roadblock/LC7 domain-containing protein [Chloroflexi bacterium]|nr:roadblock/LC7 domain-containing protein [Chloroflexota bacterium]
MIKKLFGNIDNSQSEEIPSRRDLERFLAEIALDMPQVEWLALVNMSGTLIASFPAKPRAEADRVTAMSAAMAALGERIASELNNGNLQYTLIAGTREITAMIELNSKYLLTVGLKKDVSIEELLSQMQETNLPALMKALHIEGILRLSGIQPK